MTSDFNLISSLDDRKRGSDPSLRCMEELNDLLFECGLFEIPFKGPYFA